VLNSLTYDSNFFVTSLKFKFLTSGGPLAALFCRVRRRSALTSYSASFLYNFSFVLNLCSLSTFGAFSFSSVSSFSFIFPFMIAFSIIFYFRFSNNLLTLASCFAIFLWIRLFCFSLASCSTMYLAYAWIYFLSKYFIAFSYSVRLESSSPSTAAIPATEAPDPIYYSASIFFFTSSPISSRIYCLAFFDSSLSSFLNKGSCYFFGIEVRSTFGSSSLNFSIVA